MPPRFVASGSIDAQTLALEEEREKEESKQFANERAEEERKTLAEQLKDYHAKEYAEYRSQLEQSNSTYRLDAKEAAFYEQVMRDKREKEAKAVKEEISELEAYRRAKRITSKPKVPTVTKIQKPVKTTVKIKKKPAEKPIEGVKEKKEEVEEEKTEKPLVGYDSDSD